MESNADNQVVLDPDVLKILKYRIYAMERENHKTNKYKPNEMVDKIRKLIELEVDKIDY